MLGYVLMQIEQYYSFLTTIITIFSNSISVQVNLYCAISNYIKYAFIYNLKWLNQTSALEAIYI